MITCVYVNDCKLYAYDDLPLLRSRCAPSLRPNVALQQHQPDSAFQVAPSRLALTFVPYTASKTSQLHRLKSPESLGRVLALTKTAGGTSESLKVFPNASSQPNLSVQQSLVSRSAPAIHLVDSIAPTPTEGEGKNGSPTLPSEKHSLQHRQQQSEKHTSVPERPSQPSTSSQQQQQQPVNDLTRAGMKTEDTEMDSRDPAKRQNGGCVEDLLTQPNPESIPKKPASPSTQVPTSQPHSTDPRVHLATATSENKPQPKLTVEKFKDNFTSTLAPVVEQALRTPSQVSSLLRASREGRNSSTPKPPTTRPPPQPSPTTSPVPYIAGTHGLSDTPYRPAASAQSLRLQQRKSAGWY